MSRRECQGVHPPFPAGIRQGRAGKLNCKMPCAKITESRPRGLQPLTGCGILGRMNPTKLLRTLALPALFVFTLPACSEKSKPLSTTVSATTPAAKVTKTTNTASAGSSSARRAAIVAFCRKNSGRKVGDGQCWTLANEAFKATGAKRVNGQLRVWGRQLNLRTESPLPGDILEMDRSRFSDGTYTPSNHTVVIVGVHSPTLLRISEQNMGGSRVKERDLDISGLRSGRIYIYRPQ